MPPVVLVLLGCLYVRVALALWFSRVLVGVGVRVSFVGRVLRALLAALTRRQRAQPRAAPTPPRVFDEARVFRVFVARSQGEFESFPHASRGLGALYYPAGEAFGPSVGFNFDAWPAVICAGVHDVASVLEAARAQDVAEGRPEGRLIEDIVLHEVAGHHVLGVGADHKSENTLMSGGPKRESDRVELRGVLSSEFDAFRVVMGPPTP